MHVLNTLTPVFVTIILGAVLLRTGFVTRDLLGGLTKLTYWVALPCLLFHKIALAPLATAAAGRIFVMMLGGAGACLVAALIVSWVLKIPAWKVGTVIQACFRGNIAYIGLAVVFGALSNARLDPHQAQAAQNAAALALAPVVVLYNVVSVTALLASRHRIALGTVKKIGAGLATNPLILACLAGVAFRLTGWPLPAYTGRTLQAVGQLALPAALLAIGGALASTKLSGHILHSVIAGGIKVGLGPLVGWGVGWLLGASRLETIVAMIMLACPTAVASYIMAEQLKGDTSLAAGALVVSTAMSVISLSVVVAMV